MASRSALWVRPPLSLRYPRISLAKQLRQRMTKVKPTKDPGHVQHIDWMVVVVVVVVVIVVVVFLVLLALLVLLVIVLLFVVVVVVVVVICGIILFWENNGKYT